MKTLATTLACATSVLLLGGCAGLVSRAEPAVQHSGGEDLAVKVDELRVRGQVQHLQVTPKNGSAPAYEILPPRPGADSAQQRDATGQRVWTLFSF